MANAAIGITWYRREDYARLQALFPDGDKIADTYEDWVKQAENIAGRMTLEGFTVVKAYISPKTFPAWCKARGFEMDAKARTEWSREFAERNGPPPR